MNFLLCTHDNSAEYEKLAPPYTALSRAKTASDLFIVENLKLTNKISENDPVH